MLDPKIGDAFRRHLIYSRYFNKLFIIVLNLKKDGVLENIQTGNLVIVPTNSKNRWLYFSDCITIFKRQIKKQKINIISCQDPFITAIIGIWLKLKSKAALNIQIHNDFGSRYWKNETKQNYIFYYLQKITLRFADSVRLVSNPLQGIIPPAIKSFVVPVGVNLHDFKKIPTKKIYDIICVARFERQKNIPLLLRAVKKLSKKMLNLKAIIVGEGSQFSSIQNLISQLNLQNHVFLKGARGKAEIIKLLNQSRIFVFPSNYEGWGLAAVEAAACKLPVITTDTGGAREIVINKKTGYIIGVEAENQLINKLKTLLNDSGLRKSMGRKARKHVSDNFQENKLYELWVNNLKNTAQDLKKICFILPNFDPDTPTHYAYTFKLFNQTAKTEYTALFIESGGIPRASTNFNKVIVQKIAIKPINLFERFIKLLLLRVNGYHIFFVHYSYWSLYILKFISLFLPTKIFYWHAESLKKKDLAEMTFWERLQLNLAIKLAPNLVTAGGKLAQTYSETFGKTHAKIKMVPNWIEKKPFFENGKNLKKKLKIDKNSKVILYVHRLSLRKGADYLPKIISKISRKAKNITFLIIGDGPLKKSLQNRKYPLTTIFTGNIPQKAVFKYYAIADIFIMPSRREGFPRVILEAMRAGLPIVTTDVGEVTNMLPKEQNKYIISENNLNTFASAILTLLKEKKLRNKLGKDNQKRAAAYSLDLAARQLLTVF